MSNGEPEGRAFDPSTSGEEVAELVFGAEELLELRDEVKSLAADNKRLDDAMLAAREARDGARKEAATYRERNEELKDRLVRAELNVQWLRGYVARVREDDVANEELVPTGNEDDRTPVPKRKFEPLPPDHHDGARGGADSMYVSRSSGEPRLKRKHWVNY